MKVASKASSRRCPFTQQELYGGSPRRRMLWVLEVYTLSKDRRTNVWKNKIKNKVKKKINEDGRSASESPQSTNCWRLANVWETYHYTFAFQLDCVLCMRYQPSLETGCWAPRKPLVWHSTAVPPFCTCMFCLVGAARSSGLAARGNTQALEQAPSHVWFCMIGVDILLKMRLDRDTNLGTNYQHALLVFQLWKM